MADRFDLRRYIEFSTRVTALVWDEASCSWTLTLQKQGVPARQVRYAAISLQ